jgi:predicted O-methyltransferase YrrM
MAKFNLKASEAIPGWMTADELRWLYEQASRYQSVLEVGCWQGRSASALAQGCPGKVYTVDHFEGSPEEKAHKNVQPDELMAKAIQHLQPWPHVTILPEASRSAARRFRAQSLDMVFIDGSHSVQDVLADLLLWTPKVRYLLAGHDLNWPSVMMGLAVYGVPFEKGPDNIWYMRMEET